LDFPKAWVKARAPFARVGALRVFSFPRSRVYAFTRAVYSGTENNGHPFENNGHPHSQVSAISWVSLMGCAWGVRI